MRYFYSAAALALLSVTSVMAQDEISCPTGTAPTNTAEWEACQGETDRECATIRVPKDYADASQGTIPLRLVRLAAAEGSTNVKSVIVNPGGPGQSGIETVLGGVADTLQT